MAHTDRDQRARPHSGKRCPEAKNGGCVYCITGEYKRPARVTARRGSRHVIAEALAENPDDDFLVVSSREEHIYSGERCVRCNINIYDVGLTPGDDRCPGSDEDPVFYSTKTGGTPVSTHDI